MNATAPTLVPLRHGIELPADFDSYRDIYLWESDNVEEVARSAFAFRATADCVPISDPVMVAVIEALYAHIKNKHVRTTDFTVEFNGLIFRGHRDKTLTKPLLALRRVPSQAPLLSDLDMPNVWREMFLWNDLMKGGLIVLAAVTGQGKSTTTAAIIRSRLEKYAGFCRAIEDPCELPLHGTHGKGICIQTPVDVSHGRAGFSEALRSALRSYPTLPGGSMCLVGEVRDAETAADLVRAAVNGTLVITTIHAPTVQTAVGRLLAFAEHIMGPKTAKDLLGSALRIVLHQSLTLKTDGAGWKRGKLTGEILFSKSESSQVATAIRTDGSESLTEPVRFQTTLLNQDPPLRFQEFLSKVS